MEQFFCIQHQFHFLEKELFLGLIQMVNLFLKILIIIIFIFIKRIFQKIILNNMNLYQE